MSLRRRLIYLMVCFAAFVVVAALGTVSALEGRIQDALDTFHRTMNDADEVNRYRISIRTHFDLLVEVIEQREPVPDDLRRAFDDDFRAIRNSDHFASQSAAGPIWKTVEEITNKLERKTTRCFALIKESQFDEARTVVETRIKGDLLDELAAALYSAADVLTDTWNASVRDLTTTGNKVLILAAVVLVFAVGLLGVGGWLMGKWLIVPITQLRDATERFSRGELDFRVNMKNQDELGALGSAMNSMAEHLTAAQADLHTSEAKYRTLFENLRDAVVICDGEGTIIECHDGDTHVLGGGGEDRIGRRLLEVWPEWRSDTRDWYSLIRKVITSGQRINAPDIALRHDENGEPLATADVVVYSVEYDSARYVAIILRDVTERDRMQRRLRHADRMEATGTLAGGIAHDFNNLLTSAIGTMTLLGGQIKKESQNDLIQTALRACWQAAGLSRRLLNFAAGGYHRLQLLRMADVVEYVVRSLDESIIRGISIVQECDEDVLVKADKDQLAQIILNLVHNARDAMPDGGEIRIEAQSVLAEHPESRDGEKVWIRITVSDTGVGMTPEVKTRLFEPFFTTKVRAAHRGRGLGLAIVYASVRNAGGFIQVDSQVGVGTTFRIFMQTGEGEPEPVEPPEYIGPVQMGEGTVLVVDDEPMIIEMCQQALRQWGYSVISAATISDAADLFDEHFDAIQLALIDINLPDGSGVVLAQDLIELKPDLPIIFATGFSDTDVPEAIDANVCARLSKPFALEELAQSLSAALKQEAGDDSKPSE